MENINENIIKQNSNENKENNLENIDIENQSNVNIEKSNENKVEIIGVKFEQNGKSYYFAPNGEKFIKGEKVIAETAKGLEIGVISFGNFFINETNLIAPLKPILRKATNDDLIKEQKLKEKSYDAKVLCRNLAEKYKLEMKLVDVGYLFDETKIIFSFTSEGRVDFRELVKDLASNLHTRIEMRQIGVRDETRLVGCYGMCGQECCCSRFLSDYEKVSVKMAKNQNLSLNPQKISGVCGRLLCCLGYENEHYVETLKEMPKVGSKVDTPDGQGIVTYNNLLSKYVTVRIKTDDDSTILNQYDLKDIKIYEKNNVNEKSADEDILDDE